MENWEKCNKKNLPRKNETEHKTELSTTYALRDTGEPVTTLLLLLRN